VKEIGVMEFWSTGMTVLTVSPLLYHATSPEFSRVV